MDLTHKTIERLFNEQISNLTKLGGGSNELLRF